MAELAERIGAALEDRYTLDRQIGSGGMATVFLAHDRKHDRHVALKVLRQDIAAALGPDRFLREITITAKLNHPHILPLLDSGVADEFLYYVMPHLAEGSLRRCLHRDRPLQLDVALRVVQQVAAALDHAHRHGVVHRDVKPENILFSEGHAIVADFGIARAISSAGREALTRSGVPLGTPGYMSPEQATGRTEFDARTDIFGLACVAYEMLIGETPGMWPTEEAQRLGRFVDAGPAHRARLDGLPGRVEQTLVKALAMRPVDRFPTPAEFAEALTAASERTGALSDSQVQEIIGRAAQLEVERPSDEGALSLGGVEQVAAQVGIAPEHVREAVRDLERGAAAPLSPDAAARPASTFRKGRLVVERTISGEIPDVAYEAMVHEINARLGFVGTVSGVGRSLHWSGTKPGFVGRDVRITLTRAAGQTRVHIEEHIELRGASILAPGWGAGAGALLTLAIVLGLGLPGEVTPAILIPAAGAGGILGAVGLVRSLARRYGPQLEELADRLQALAEQAIEESPEAPPSGGTR
jgi:hypothetical protein